MAPNSHIEASIRIKGQNADAKMILKMLQLKPPPPINSDSSSDEELETALISSEEHGVGEIHMSENSSSLGKNEHTENVATEEEDPTKNCPGGFHSVWAGDTCDCRSCRLHHTHISVFSALFCAVTFG